MAVPAAAAGSWTLGDLPVHRLGFGAMRLTGHRPAVPTPRPPASGPWPCSAKNVAAATLQLTAEDLGRFSSPA